MSPIHRAREIDSSSLRGQAKERPIGKEKQKRFLVCGRDETVSCRGFGGKGVDAPKPLPLRRFFKNHEMLLGQDFESLLPY